jgi:phenylalanine-4-hydroxylase
MSDPAFTPATEEAPVSAYEKEGVADIDPRCIPQTLDGAPPVGDEIAYPAYPDEDHENWRFLFERQMRLLPGRAGAAYLRGVEKLDMTPDKIPALRDLSAALEREAGWRVARIPGLLHERDFFTLLSQRLFPSTDYIRGKEELDYTPAPDLFHDIFGHMPMLTEPAFADFYQLFGQAALGAQGKDRQSLERLHWFTVEFGLIRDPAEIRIFGAGVLSSKGEVVHALDTAEQRPFSVEAVIAQDYDVWQLQPVLFVLESFDQLVTEFRGWAGSRGLLPAA